MKRIIIILMMFGFLKAQVNQPGKIKFLDDVFFKKVYPKDDNSKVLTLQKNGKLSYSTLDSVLSNSKVNFEIIGNILYLFQNGDTLMAELPSGGGSSLWEIEDSILTLNPNTYKGINTNGLIINDSLDVGFAKVPIDAGYFATHGAEMLKLNAFGNFQNFGRSNKDMYLVGFIAPGLNSYIQIDTNLTKIRNDTIFLDANDITANGNLTANDITANGNLTANDITANGNLTANDITANDITANNIVPIYNNADTINVGDSLSLNSQTQTLWVEGYTSGDTIDVYVPMYTNQYQYTDFYVVNRQCDLWIRYYPTPSPAGESGDVMSCSDLVKFVDVGGLMFVKKEY